MTGEEINAKAPKYRAVDALSGTVRHQTELEQIDACLDGGGHYWNDPDPGDNYHCTRCPNVGAQNWPTINESS